MSNSDLSFGAACASGGDWFACGNGPKFVGCCTVDPCNENGCSTRNTRPATFDASAFGTFSDQTCSEGSWFTCSGTDPPFMGCCTSNPCSGNGCPSSDLRAASLSDNDDDANQFKPDPPLGSSTTSTTTTTRATATPSSTSNLITSQTPAPASKPTQVPKIVGGAVGGAAILLIVIAFLVWRWYRYVTASRREFQKTQDQRMATAMIRSPVGQTAELDGGNYPTGDYSINSTTSQMQSPPNRFPTVYSNGYTLVSEQHQSSGFNTPQGIPYPSSPPLHPTQSQPRGIEDSLSQRSSLDNHTNPLMSSYQRELDQQQQQFQQPQQSQQPSTSSPPPPPPKQPQYRAYSRE